MPQQQHLQQEASDDPMQCATPAESCSGAGGDNPCTFTTYRYFAAYKQTDAMRAELQTKLDKPAGDIPTEMAKLQAALDEERAKTRELKLQLTVLGARLDLQNEEYNDLVNEYNKLLKESVHKGEEEEKEAEESPKIQELEYRLAVVTQELKAERARVRDLTKLYPSAQAGELFYG